MKFFDHIRSKSKGGTGNSTGGQAQVCRSAPPQPKPYRRIGGHLRDLRLPKEVLERIFAHVCPHTQDESYTASEESMIEDGCMLCDMRDLAKCALVCSAWAAAAQSLLYRSVRLDAVHYCDREAVLAERRKRRSFFERNGDPQDATLRRLQLFSAIVRERKSLADSVHVLKMPYMTRETSKADLARTVSVLPNLQYVDLPEGFYSDDPASNILKQALLHRCPDIRKMKYAAGSEQSFTLLAHKRQWQNLKILELSSLRVGPDTLLYVLASFPTLHVLKLQNVSSLDDTIFEPNSSLPPFPSLTALELTDAPNVTSTGLRAYLSRIETREFLLELSFARTGIVPATLHEVLTAAPRLDSLKVNETVSRSFPLTPIPPLASRTLRILRYEILPESSAANDSAETYYTYLANSLLSSSLPSLNELYAFSLSIVDILLYPPNNPLGNLPSPQRNPFTPPRQIHSSQPQMPSGLVSPLNLYTKSAATPELEWYLTYIEPPSAGNGRQPNATPTHPLSLAHGDIGGLRASSSHGLGAGRESVLVGNGFGGFLAVPDTSPGRPNSSHGRKGSANKFDWMG
ncbi:MAG: hypothetical protein MMC33_002945 [Icmadophila ericetorum]|nr:hypothetical protein [Icmadophila ericetorum]